MYINSTFNPAAAPVIISASAKSQFSRLELPYCTSRVLFSPGFYLFSSWFFTGQCAVLLPCLPSGVSEGSQGTTHALTLQKALLILMLQVFMLMQIFFSHLSGWSRQFMHDAESLGVLGVPWSDFSCYKKPHSQLWKCSYFRTRWPAGFHATF